jgi:hypothetical protein
MPDADRERIRNAVLSTVGVTVTAAAATGAGAASAAAATTATSSIVTKLIVVIVALGAIGGGTALLSRKQSAGVGNQRVDVGKQQAVATQPSTSREVIAPSVDTPAPIESQTTPAPRPPAPVTRPQTPPPHEARATSAPAASEPSESDARRLARAVAASERGDAAEALAVLDGVASSSALVEERDALRIIVLQKLGRTDDACAGVTTFVARYPQSIHRAAVEEVRCSDVQ